MNSSLLQRVRTLFDDADDERNTDSPERPATSLMTCPDCEKTFIVEQMDTCPDCQTVVEETPTERDLGFW